LVDVDDTTIIDLGILQTIHEHLPRYGPEVLGFYYQLTGLSDYARNAVACTGILSDVVKLCGLTDDEELQVLSAQLIFTVFRQDDPIPEEDLGLPDLVALLKLPNRRAVFFILSALVEIVVATRGELVSELYTQGVHEFIAETIADAQLRAPSLCLAGNMGICDPAELKLLSDCGVIAAVIGCAEERDCLSSVLWGLSNCIRSDPELMCPRIPETLVDTALALGGTVQFADAAVFLATLLLFCPLRYVSRLAKPRSVAFLVKGLGREVPAVTVRVLNALGRVLFLGLTNEQMKFTVPIIQEAIGENDVLNALSAGTEKVIANKASILREEISRSGEEAL
jgi:hypothetical protein